MEPRATCLPWETGTTATSPARQRNRGTRRRQALHETAPLRGNGFGGDSNLPNGGVRRRLAIPVCSRPVARELGRCGRAAPGGRPARAAGAEALRSAEPGYRELGRAHGGLRALG